MVESNNHNGVFFKHSLKLTFCTWKQARHQKEASTVFTTCRDEVQSLLQDQHAHPSNVSAVKWGDGVDVQVFVSIFHWNRPELVFENVTSTFPAISKVYLEPFIFHVQIRVIPWSKQFSLEKING